MVGLLVSLELLEGDDLRYLVEAGFPESLAEVAGEVGYGPLAERAVAAVEPAVGRQRGMFASSVLAFSGRAFPDCRVAQSFIAPHVGSLSSMEALYNRAPTRATSMVKLVGL